MELLFQVPLRILVGEEQGQDKAMGLMGRIVWEVGRLKVEEYTVVVGTVVEKVGRLKVEEYTVVVDKFGNA